MDHPKGPWPTLDTQGSQPTRRPTPAAGQRVWCPGLEETAPDRGMSSKWKRWGRGRTGQRGPRMSPELEENHWAREAAFPVSSCPISRLETEDKSQRWCF